MALTAFRRIQAGLESTRGTPVAADKKLIGSLSVTPEITWHRPTDERNSLANFRRAVAVAKRSSLRYEADATYQQIIDILSMASKGNITPSTPTGATNSRLWTFTPNLSASNAQDAYTIQYGDDTQAWIASFCMVSSLELSIALNQVLTLRAELFAHHAEKGSFTGSIADPTVVEIVANNLKVYIDNAWSGLGVTEFADLVTGGSIRLTTGLVPVKYADGLLNFSNFVEQRRNLELTLEMVVGSGAIAEYDAYVAGTTRAIRLKFTSGEEIEPGFNYTFTIDMLGKYSAAPEIFGERDGENLLSMQLVSHEGLNVSTPVEMEFAVQNNVVSI